MHCVFCCAPLGWERGKRYSIAELRPADAPSIACPSDVGALLFRRAQAFF
jgi:hypothetical protein